MYKRTVIISNQQHAAEGANRKSDNPEFKNINLRIPENSAI